MWRFEVLTLERTENKENLAAVFSGLFKSVLY